MKYEYERTYLGDSVYLAWDGSCFILTTNDGTGIKNQIYLSEEELENMMIFIKKIKSKNFP